MKLLSEVLRGVQRMPEQPAEEPVDQLADPSLDVDPNAEQDPALGEPTDEENPELDGVVDTAVEDPDRAGLIRAVAKAHLVYKRASDDGTYTELWLYNIQTMQQQSKIKRAILAGTDIPPNQTESPDGSQAYTVWAVGNAEMLEITGLPS